MRILNLQIYNLNSLYGKWSIDFTDPEYLTNGIFALTGPTGAGKSTILDAICLALYGQTPRLSKVTKATNEIMSRQVGECYAKVVFESKKGRFRCHWEQHKANKKASGNLQEPEQWIVDDITNKVLKEKKTEIKDVIVEKTGLDFDRFTRSVLLAQGGFDSFLKAKTEDKSKILEQITGTEIYTEISMHVYDRYKHEKELQDKLKFEIVAVEILSDKQIKEIAAKLKELEQEGQGYKNQLEQVTKGIEWLNNIATFEIELKNLLSKEEIILNKIKAFEPTKEKLILSKKANKYLSKFEKIQLLRQQQAEDQEKHRAFLKNKPRLEVNVDKSKSNLNKEKVKLKQLKNDHIKQKPILIKVRKLDQQMKSKGKECDNLEKMCDVEANEIKSLTDKLKTEEDKKVKHENSLTKINKYLNDNASHKWLVKNLTGVEVKFDNYYNLEEKIQETQENITENQEELDNSKQNLIELEDEIKNQKAKIKSTQELRKSKTSEIEELLAGKTLREYRKDRDNLLKESSYIAQINDLQDIRAKLEDGKVCPVCGSTEHPFAKGNLPSKTNVDKEIEKLSKLISKLENTETAISELNKDLAKLKIQHENLTGKLASTNNDIANTKKVLDKQIETKKKYEEEFTKIRAEILKALTPIGIKVFNEKTLDKLRELLDQWQQSINSKEDLQQDISKVILEITKFNETIATKRKNLSNNEELHEKAVEEFNKIFDERKELFGDKDPDDEEEKLVSEIEECESHIEELTEEHNNDSHQLSICINNIKNIETAISKRNSEISKSVKLFLDQIKAIGINSEDEYIKARLTEEKQEQLEAQEAKLKEEQQENKLKKNDRQTKLKNEFAKNVTEKELSDLKQEKREIESNAGITTKEIGSLNQQITNNEKNKEKIRAKETKFEKQKLVTRKWSKLNTLIGSADGKKYRNIAQGLTFELMIKHANNQLQKMSDRYILLRDEKQPIELNVIDNYQAGEIRTIKNLSGGEVLSLA